MQREAFLEALLLTMEQKEHWAWPLFTSGKVEKDKLHIHFEQEYEVYVRDFPVLIGRAYVQCPVAEARKELAENLYEEETGGLIAGRPHPELFLEYPKGLGMDMNRFNSVKLLPKAVEYRAFLDHATTQRGWEAASAVTTLFVEGTSRERGEVDDRAKKRSMPPLEAHPLVQHYGLPIESLALTKAHRQVEGSHRQSAWHVVLDHVGSSARVQVIETMHEAVERWKAYRDDVAHACGLHRET